MKVEIDKINASVDLGFANQLPNYFKWRQEKFNPLHHWPLQGEEGDDKLPALTNSPPVVLGNSFVAGAESLVYPKRRYTALERIPGSRNTRSRIEGFTGGFLNSGDPFTIVIWFQYLGGSAILDNSWLEGPGIRLNGGNLDGRYGFTYADEDGDRTRTSFLRLDVSRSDRDPSLPTHIAVLCDGEEARLWINGEIQGDKSAPWEPITDEPNVDMALGGNSRVVRSGGARYAGLIMDDKKWSVEDLRKDYFAGLANVEVLTGE